MSSRTNWGDSGWLLPQSHTQYLSGGVDRSNSPSCKFLCTFLILDPHSYLCFYSCLTVITTVYPPIPEVEWGEARWDCFVSPSRVTSRAFPGLFLNRSLLMVAPGLMLFISFLLLFSSQHSALETVLKERKQETLFRFCYTTLTFGIWEKNILESKAENPFFFLLLR